MHIVAGLGNPGREYVHTRHNAGFLVVDNLADRYKIDINKTKFKGLCGEGLIGIEKTVILKPQTYMNLSGESILDAIQFYKINLDNLIIVYDDINMPLGRIRIRPSGSDGGHNGMKSIIYLLGNNCFPRVRIGIGAPRSNMVSHVIGRFSEDEKKIINDVLIVASDAVSAIVEKGVQAAMNLYNCYRHESLNIDIESD